MSSYQYPDALPVTTTGGWLDILTGGEHRRSGWIEGITGSMPGLKMRPAPRKLGTIGWGMLPVCEVQRPLDGIESIWDYASEYRFLRPRTERTYRWLSRHRPTPTCTGSAWNSAPAKWRRSTWSANGIGNGFSPLGQSTSKHYSKTSEDTIERVRTCLEYRDPERLEISTGCGLRRVPRYLAISKMSPAAGRLRASG